ncbi:MAG: 4-amino-4-deoxy-L-arabinose transferase-like glycosyltransferase [Planctomycetota bacterium]|jgi:4-amino-4-deoxy-L-arabinose transferase-like glycosyltransferase
MDSPFGESVPVLAERKSSPVGARELALVVLVLLLGLVFRSLNLNDAWSGRPNDFHSAFGGGSTGGPAKNFVTHGFGETLGVPIEWRVELEDGSRVYSYYPHHPTTCISITALSMMLFGPSEWASRLPWVLASLLALFGVWRLARLIWNPTVALTAMLFTAVIPFAAFFASMQWIDGLVVFLYTLILYRYVLWLRKGERRDLIFAAGYAFLGGFCEWSAIFILPGLGIHALIVFGGKREWRALASTLLLPAGVLLGFAVHAIHLRMVLSPEELANDTSSTLAWVTSLPVPLSRFLSLQWAFLQRYLTPPVTVLVLLGGAWALRRCLRFHNSNRLSREEGVLLPLFLAGVLYVAVFPARSFNHNFFVGLSVPFFGIISALLSLALFQVTRRAKTIGASAPACLFLIGLGIYAAFLASERNADVEISLSEPQSLLFLPLLAARNLPIVLAIGSLFACVRGKRVVQANFALACALSGAISFAAWDDVRFWITQRSNQVKELIEEPWMDELLHDSRAVIITTGNVSMPLQFYSDAPVFISIYSVEQLRALKARILSKLGEGRRVAFLFETLGIQRDAKAGRLKPDVVEKATQLRDLLVSITSPTIRNELEVFELGDWARSKVDPANSVEPK